MDKLAVGIPEAAEMIGVGRSSLYILFGNGKLKAFKCGRRTLVKVSEIAAYIDSLPAAPVGKGSE